MLGVFLFGLGEILAGFLTTNVVGLFMTIGFVAGLGTRSVSIPEFRGSLFLTNENWTV
jgi:hypothetical protein